MAFADQVLEPGELFRGPVEVVGVAVAHRVVERGRVAPGEPLVGPGGPGQEQDGGHAQVHEIIEPVADRVERRPHTALAGGAVVDHQFVDDQVAERPAAAGKRPHQVVRRPAAADDQGRVQVAAAAVAGERVAHPADRFGRVAEADQVLVLVETGGQGLVSGTGPGFALGVGLAHQLRRTRRIPVPAAQVVLEVAAHADGIDVVGQAAFLVREEHPKRGAAAVPVVADLPGTEPLLHVVHGGLRVVPTAAVRAGMAAAATSAAGTRSACSSGRAAAPPGSRRGCCGKPRSPRARRPGSSRWAAPRPGRGGCGWNSC